MRSAADYAGRWLVLYVYPKDDTPGCTIQGRSFSATRAEFEARNVVVVGLSADDVASHQSFCNKHGLTVDLLSDPQAVLLGALGVGQTDFHGTLYWNRTTFVVDPQGVLRRVYERVNPEGHEQALLRDIRAMQEEVEPVR